MQKFTPDIIYIEKSVQTESVTKNILNSLPDVPKVHVDGLIHADETITRGKRVLQVVRQKGAFLSECPGSPNMICCGYHVLNNAFNCNFDCTYCFLQSYVNNRVMTVYANIDDMFREIDSYLKEHKEFTEQNPLRLGTGEFSDSLALDHLTGLSEKLIEYFSKKPNVIFELKSKSNEIAGALKAGSTKNIVMSWSLNTPKMIEQNELKTATLEERLAAATKCAEAGYKIGFHFDPLINYKNWVEDYGQVVEALYKAVPAEQVIWISLGTFRFNAPLKPIIRKRFPDNPIVAGEFITGPDGKMRYFKEIRVEMYKQMLQFIRSHAPNQFVYLCMEAPYVWEKVFGNKLGSTQELVMIFNKDISLKD